MSNGKDECKQIWPCQFCGEGTTEEFVNAAVNEVSEWAERWRRGIRNESLNDCLQKLAKRFPNPKDH